MNLVKLLAVLALAYGAYFLYQDRSAPSGVELQGHWKSHKGKSMRFFQEGGLTNRQEHALNSILGKMTLEVTDSLWITDLDGDVDRIPYSILSQQDNCYNLKLDNHPTWKVCLVDGDLHVPGGWRDATEVFVRRRAPGT